MSKITHFSVLILLLLSILLFDVSRGYADGSFTVAIGSDGSVSSPDLDLLSTVANTYTLTNNMVGNIIVECDNIVLDGAGFTIHGGLILYSCSNVTIQNFVVIDGDYESGYLLNAHASFITICNNRLSNGILFLYLSNSVICGNNMTNVDFHVEVIRQSTIIGNFISHGSGLDLGNRSQPSYNYIAENTIIDTNCGIRVGDPTYDMDGWNNTITQNLIVNNDIGILLGACRYTAIYDNNVINNQVGIAGRNYCGWTLLNYVYHNNFINNTQQVHIIEEPLDPQFECSWDNGYPSGGNYWSDYNGTDLYSSIYQNETSSDGFGDTPFIFDEDNQDNFPFIEPVPTAPYPLFAYFTFRPTFITAGQEIQFDASLTYDQDIVSYHWNFGENVTYSQLTPVIVHTFPVSGTYPVTLTVIDNQGMNASYTNTLLIRMPTDLSITTTSSSSVIGFVTTINGTLTDIYDVGLRNEPIRLFYRASGIDTWNPITSTSTDSFGQYIFNWIPVATGNFTLKAVWDGNATHIGVTSTTNLNSLVYSDQYVFSVESNSTITHLAFDTTTWQLHFTASGPSNTRGWVKVTMAKTLVSDINAVQAYIDNSPLEYTYSSLADSWVLQLVYSHSEHAILLDLNQPVSLLNGNLSSVFLVFSGILCGVILCFSVMKLKTRSSIAR